MTPTQWAVQPFKKYASFSGRAPRAEYWGFAVVTLIGGFICGFIDGFIGSKIVAGLFNLAMLLPSLAVTVRRFHDTNRSGTWYLLVIFAAILGVVLAVGGTSSGDLSFGSLTGLAIAGILIVVAASILLIVFLVLPGTKGPNQYGPDPYGEGHEKVFA